MNEEDQRRLEPRNVHGAADAGGTDAEGAADAGAKNPLARRVISLGRVHSIGLACLPLLLFALLFARFAASHRVIPRLTLGGVQVGGASAEETKRLLTERGRALAKEKLCFVLSAKQSCVSVEQLGLELVVADSVSRALGVGRSAGVL